MSDHRQSCMIVDDDFLIVQYLQTVLEELGHDVCAVAHSAEEATRKAIEHDPSVIFMDVRLGGERDGVDAAIEIHNKKPTPIYFITGSSDPRTVDRINQDSPSGIFFKPIDPHDLKEALSARA